MNSIIRTLVNGEINNKTKQKLKTELPFVVVLYLADRKDYHFLNSCI